MVIDNVSQQNSDRDSYGSILKELGLSAKDVIQSEIQLASSEVRFAAKKVAEHASQAAIFGGLLAISVFPFLAFLVIGLGNLMDGRYWLSSLIVAVVCAAIGGPMALRAFRKIKEQDLAFSYTRDSLDQGLSKVQQKMTHIKEAAKGEYHGSIHVH
jgi:cation transport ATPase